MTTTKDQRMPRDGDSNVSTQCAQLTPSRPVNRQPKKLRWRS